MRALFPEETLIVPVSYKRFTCISTFTMLYLFLQTERATIAQYISVADPDLQISRGGRGGWGSHPDPEISGMRRRTQKQFFFRLFRLQFGQKIRPLDPPPHINPFSPKSDRHQFSPNNIHTMSRDKVLRINKMIISGKMP